MISETLTVLAPRELGSRRVPGRACSECAWCTRPSCRTAGHTADTGGGTSSRTYVCGAPHSYDWSEVFRTPCTWNSPGDLPEGRQNGEAGHRRGCWVRWGHPGCTVAATVQGQVRVFVCWQWMLWAERQVGSVNNLVGFTSISIINTIKGLLENLTGSAWMCTHSYREGMCV